MASNPESIKPAQLPPLAVVPRRYVRPHIASAATGLSVKAMEQKIDNGVWREGFEWKKGPDGRRYIDLEGYDRWVASGGG